VYALELTGDELEARKFLLEQPCVLGVDGAEGKLIVTLDEGVEKIDALIVRLVQAGVRFCQLERRRADLEDVFMRMTSRRSDGPPA
jgi:hypothetical protein